MENTTGDDSYESAQSPAAAALRARALELEELRRRNVAKAIQGQLDGKGQPITKETFYLQQKHQLELIKQQKLDAEANLHNFRNTIVTVSDSTKEELKKKEMEAAALLHSYRGKPEAILSHQVKKFSNLGSRENLQYFEGYTPDSHMGEGASFAEARSVYDASPGSKNLNMDITSEQDVDKQKEGGHQEAIASSAYNSLTNSLDQGLVSSSPNNMTDASGNSGLLQQDDSSQHAKVTTMCIEPTADVPKEEESDMVEIHHKNSESSNENSTESTGWVVLKEEADVDNTTADVDNTTDHVRLNENNLENDGIALQPKMPIRGIHFVTVSFSLLTDAANAPAVGDRIDSDLLRNLINDMKIVLRNSLQQIYKGGEVTSDEQHPYQIDVFSDDTFNAPRDRPNVVKRLVRVRIPLIHDNTYPVAQCENTVRSVLKNYILESKR